ncbi:iron transporter [ANME-1 cluster archaeon AG-394-G21]|nr:iron transporter [ANME-1 cluster archaeon AG-394-G21]NAT11300.1 iron transporter [ANME-1 cluster archaeon AG-394-G06]
MVERNLSDLEPGDTCKVTHVGGSGGERRRMMDMGIVRGSRIEVVRKAPMGDPVEFLLRGYNLTLRKQEAEVIRVEVKEEGG